ncbi:MAG TPA: bifunctional methylenetetrahydrofolate dehydrogenase/methenyltetrahydrofolate cyclohydrolase FolD [Saprospiraceae bacterium]|nr:bifunctional methylenetetrahydrofolate dehydrogenase/methenyltetrahydrofolate cyclohydrolase FolD [Saprospiraceae bacterium]
MQLIDGKALALQIQYEIRAEVEAMVGKSNRPPHLAAILVGDDPASHAYVRNKVKACETVGFSSTLIRKDSEISQAELMELIEELNSDPSIDGFIVQLPLPGHIDETKVTMAINPGKDVDGFHPCNFGRMALGLPAYIPATPLGILTMLERYHIETAGKKVVVVGRSNIVGTPIGVLLSRKSNPGNATVTFTHSRTKNINKELLDADIIIAAIGMAYFIKKENVKPGAVVIDVGINRVEDATRKSGYKLVGDVDFDGVAEICSYITPVPGGVGPMTVTALLMNTLKAARREIYS